MHGIKKTCADRTKRDQPASRGAVCSATNRRFHQHMSRNMMFPTMWYVRLAKPQISLRIRAV